MENRIINYIDMNVTAMTADERRGFREFLHRLELESFTKERESSWGEEVKRVKRNLQPFVDWKDKQDRKENK